jgi:hypothetical protein
METKVMQSANIKVRSVGTFRPINPKYSLIVVINDPKGAYYAALGGWAALQRNR